MRTTYFQKVAINNLLYYIEAVIYKYRFKGLFLIHSIIVTVIIRSRKGARRGGARSCLARRRKKGSRVTPAVLRGRGAVRGARDARGVRRARPGLVLIIIGFEMIKIPWWIRHKSG